MPRRKLSRGGGRPPGEYSKLTDEEKKAYHTQATQVHRGKKAETKGPAEESSEEQALPKARGRPPLHDEAMTPNTLRRRKRDVMASKRHDESVSVVRKKAAKVRWQLEHAEQPGTSEQQSSDEHDEGPSCSKTSTSSISSRQLFRVKAQLLGLLPSNPFDNLDTLFQYLSSYYPTIDAAQYKYVGRLSLRQRRYRAKTVNDIVSKYPEDVQNELLQYWLGRLVDDRIVENILQHYEIQFPSKILPKTFHVSRISQNLTETFLSRYHTSDDQRKQGTLYGGSDLSSDSEDDTSDENLAPGEIVWAKYGKTWYPAQIVSHCDVPVKLQKTLFRSKGEDFVVVKWYGEDRYSKVRTVNVDILAENKVDAARAAKSDRIHLLYQLALADLRQD